MRPFERRCVAFLDVLGFKRIVTDAEASPAGFARLRSLKTVLDSHVHWDNKGLAPSVEPRHHPKYIFVSDSIILSTPDDETGRGAIVVKCIQIANKLLEMGVLLRGAIHVGSVWHDSTNIVGTGYNEAYCLECTDADGPRIILSEAMADAWKAGPLASSSMVLQDNDGYARCNVLLSDYIRGASEFRGRIEDYFQQVRAWIVCTLEDLQPKTRPYKHWVAMATYFNQSLQMNGLDHLGLIDV